jgi:dihydroorotase-like cyclic amidohydrolase
MNERLLDNSSVVLLGSDGKLGNSFMKRFSSLGLKGIDYSDAHAAQHEVEAEIEAHKRLTFLVAVSAEYQVQVHQTLFKAIENARNASQNSTWIVNPNSVQDQVPKELEYRMNDIPENTTLFGLHPHHGHTLMNDGVVDKNWLVTYAKRFDRDQPKEEKATDIFKTWIKRKFREGAIADIALFDLNEAARPLPQFRNGAELHDK